MKTSTRTAQLNKRIGQKDTVIEELRNQLEDKNRRIEQLEITISESDYHRRANSIPIEWKKFSFWISSSQSLYLIHSQTLSFVCGFESLQKYLNEIKTI